MVFDEAAARTHYESFLFRYFAEDWGADKAQQRFKGTAKRKDLPVTTLDRWPVDTTVGVYANSPGKLGKFTWLAAQTTAWPKDRPESENKDVTLGALEDMSYHLMNGFNADIRPVYCAPANGISFAFKGAAACYVTVQAEYAEPGFWVALRELEGRVVIVGVLEQKRALEEPEKDRALKPFLAAIEKQLAPKNSPKPTRKVP